MKNFLKVFCAAMLLLSFAACTDKDNENDNNRQNDNNNYSTLLLGTWQVDRMTVNGEDNTPQNMKISFYENGRGLMNDGGETDHNDFSWVINDKNIKVTTDHDQFNFTIDNLNANECDFHGNYIKLDDQEINGDIRFHLVKSNGDIPSNPDRGDLGIGTPELWERTESSLTIHAHVTGSVDQYLWQFPNYTCGLIWCPASEGTPTMNSNVYKSNGDDIYYVIEGLSAGTTYNVIAWLKLTPDSEPILSEMRTYTTENGGSNDTNWIRLVDAMPASGGLLVTVTAYFDGNPTSVGVAYSTTNETPTINDNVYNAFEHLNMETGEHDNTIQRVQENADGSRTVVALLQNLQSDTYYYLRAYAQLSTGTVIYSTEGISISTE